jgi:hypothetical protein
VTPIHRGVLLALAGFGLYATHDAIIKHLGGSYSPFQIVFFSVLFGFPMVTFLMMRDAQPGTCARCIRGGPRCAPSAAVVTAATAFYAFTAIPLAQVYAILFAAPLLITLLAIPILGERVGIHRGLAVLVGLGGVIVVLQPTTTLTRRPRRGRRRRGRQRACLRHHAQDRAGGTRRRDDPLSHGGQFRGDGRGDALRLRTHAGGTSRSWR